MNAKNTDKARPLHLATQKGNHGTMQQFTLSQKCFTIQSLKYVNKLHKIISIRFKLGQETIAKLLVENGAHVNTRNGDGFTALHLAAQYGDVS